jgi:glutamate--cysteine ligase
MPSPHRRLTLDAVAAHVDVLVVPRRPDRQVGIELEWLVADAADRSRRLTVAECEAVIRDVGDLPHGGRLTIEPGGQLELSTAPHPDHQAACEAAATDLFRLDQSCQRHGLELIALGADPVRPPQRIVGEPRYDAMQRHFDRTGRSGVMMMCNTASIQLNVGLGLDRDDMARRWHRANALGPVLLASFANAPLAEGRPAGWQSSRLRAWWAIDPTRTAPVPLDREPAAAWRDYALAADVMLIRRDDTTYVEVEPGFTFAHWLACGHELGWPTLDDLDYHLTTLFPPVRPRGWFELRMFDALPTPFWQVAVAITTALLDDDAAGEGAVAAALDTADLWVDAAQLGLAHPAIGRAAAEVFALALDALPRLGADEAMANVASTYYDRWVARGRCPADDRLDAWRVDGSLFPRSESPLPYATFAELWS